MIQVDVGISEYTVIFVYIDILVLNNINPVNKPLIQSLQTLLKVDRRKECGFT